MAGVWFGCPDVLGFDGVHVAAASLSSRHSRSKITIQLSSLNANIAVTGTLAPRPHAKSQGTTQFKKSRVGFASLSPPLSQRIQLSSIRSERNALPRTAIRGRAAGDRIEPTLSHLWLQRSVIASASSSDPDGCRNTWFAQQGGVDEDDTD